MSARRCLLLSGHIGAGHDVVAAACTTALTERGVECRTLDSIDLLGERSGAIGEWVFRHLFSSPAVYDSFHFSQLRGGSRLARALDRTSLRNMWPRFHAEAERFDPDLVVSVFSTGGAVADRYKDLRPDVTSAVFCTDTWVHRLWVHPRTDLYLVTSDVAAASVHAYEPRAHVEIVPAPARPAFYDAPSRADARTRLGIPPDARCVLLMAGAWGVAPLDDAARALADAGFTVLAVAGRNDGLREHLDEVSDGRSIVVFGFTDRVPELMAASDVVVTTAGNTCTEARTIGRGMILLDVVPGHGRENLMHEITSGNAAVAPPQPAALVESVRAFLDCPGGRDGEPIRSAEQWEKPFLTALGV